MKMYFCLLGVSRLLNTTISITENEIFGIQYFFRASDFVFFQVLISLTASFVLFFCKLRKRFSSQTSFKRLRRSFVLTYILLGCAESGGHRHNKFDILDF